MFKAQVILGFICFSFLITSIVEASNKSFYEECGDALVSRTYNSSIQREVQFRKEQDLFPISRSSLHPKAERILQYLLLPRDPILSEIKA